MDCRDTESEIKNIWNDIISHLKPYNLDFEKSLSCSKNTQEKLLKQIITNGKDSVFGKKYSFNNINSINDFQKFLPLTTYEDHKKFLNFDKENCLLSKKFLFHEFTSGSTSAYKKIPFTADSLSALRSGIYPWIYDLLINRPAITNGKAYFSISPLRILTDVIGNTKLQESKSDLNFFSENLKPLLSKVLLGDNSLGKIKNIEEWKFKTSLMLLEEENLSFISIWSPTFLISILNYIKANYRNLITQINNKSRFKFLSQFKKTPLSFEKIWEKLDTISCWADGSSKPFFEDLKAIFPNIFFQPKGLIATESLVTIPYSKYKGRIINPNSAFFEFKQNDNIFLLDQLSVNNTYEVIITNLAGLYRYQLFDLVKVEKIVQGIPTFSFLGRSNKTSDLVGEKLSEAFVAKIFNTILPQHKKVLIAEADKNKKPFYKIVIEAEYVKSEIVSEFKKQFSTNPHYLFATQAGQLGTIEVETTTSIFKYIDNLFPNFFVDGHKKFPTILI